MAAGTAAILGSAAISAAASGGSAIYAGKQNKKNRDWQDKNWERQQQQNLQNWQMQNKYNEDIYNQYMSPAAQMRQLKEAGLNPYMMYSQGIGQMQGVQAGKMENPQHPGNPSQFDGSSGIQGVGNAFQNALMTMLQKRQMDSQLANDATNRANTDAKTINEVQRLNEMKIDVLQKIENLEQTRKTNPSQARKLEAEYSKIISDINYQTKTLENKQVELQQNDRRISQTDMQIQLERTRVQLQQAGLQLEARRIAQDDRRISIQETVSRTQNRLTEQMTYSEKEKGRKLVQEIYNLSRSANLTDAQIKEVMAKLSLIDAQTFKTYVNSGTDVISSLFGILKPANAAKSAAPAQQQPKPSISNPKPRPPFGWTPK